MMIFGFLFMLVLIALPIALVVILLTKPATSRQNCLCQMRYMTLTIPEAINYDIYINKGI